MGQAAFTVAYVPDDITTTLLAGPSGTRVLASYSGCEVDQTRLLSAGDDGAHCLLRSVEKQRAYGLNIGDTVEAQLLPDTSDYAMPVLKMWRALLDVDPALAHDFDALTPGGSVAHPLRGGQAEGRGRAGA